MKANRLKQDEMGEAGIPALETVLTKQNQRLKSARINANWVRSYYVLIEQMRQLKDRQVKQFSQGYTAKKWQNWN